MDTGSPCCIVYKTTHTEKTQGGLRLRPQLLQGCGNWTWFNHVCVLQAELCAGLLKLGWLASLHEWFSDHVILRWWQQLPSWHRGSTTQEKCGFALGNSMLQHETQSWMATIVLTVNRHWMIYKWWREPAVSCFKQNGNLALSLIVQALAKLLIKACCWEFSKALGQELQSRVQGEILNRMIF